MAGPLKELQELDLLHWMTFGSYAGVVGGPAVSFEAVERRLPEAFADSSFVAGLLFRSVELSGGLTPWGARALVWLCRNRARAFSEVFHQTVNTAEELLLFASAYTRAHRHWGRMAKEHIAQWIELRLTPEQALSHRKYHARHAHSLADLVRLSHPAFGGRKSDAVAWLLRKWEPGDTGPWVLCREGADRQARREALTHYRVPSAVAEMVAGRDPELWTAALPSLSEWAILSALPWVATWVSPESLTALAGRLGALLPDPVALVRVGWKIPVTPRTESLRALLRDLLVSSAKALFRPPGRTLVLIERSGSIPPPFFREALAASSFLPTRLCLVDDVVVDIPGGPRELLSNLGLYTPRGGYTPQRALQLALREREPFDRILIFTREYPFTREDSGPILAAVLERYRATVNPDCLCTAVLPGGLPRTPGRPSHADRLVYGTSRVPAVLPWLRSPGSILSAVRSK